MEEVLGISGEVGHSDLLHKAQRIKGNQQDKAGYLVPYQCGEAVSVERIRCPNPKCGRHILDVEEMPPGRTVLDAGCPQGSS